MPFTLIIDRREKHPYRFLGLRADAKFKNVPLAIPTAFGFLKSGDYSILGFEDRVAIERKSVVDLYSTLGQHRDRFQREHERMAALDFAAVVIEGSWDRVLNHPPEWSRLLPKTVYRTALAWQIRYGVHWIPCEDRRMGEVTTFRLLEKWWAEVQRKRKS